jgi:Ca-activated chloride channel family protein
MTGLARSVAAAMLLLWTAVAAEATDRVIVILDASGSMWAQIDGKPKLEIARESLRAALQSIPGDEEIGFMAYGHREKGSCSDIELIVPPQAGSASAIIQAADSMKFLGKTPLTAAVKQAAEALKYTEDKAKVILITDGLETCGGDPCALGKELEASGVDFTADVVGFGLTAEEGRQVACLAENTGGKYIQASDEAALKEALAETVAAPVPAPVPAPEPQPAPAPAEVDYNLTPRAVLKDGGPAPDNVDVFYEAFKDDAQGTQGQHVDFGYNHISFKLPAGDYIVVATSGGARAEQKVSLTADKTSEVMLNLNAAALYLRARPAPGAEIDGNAQLILDYPGGSSASNYGEVKFVVPAGETRVTVKLGAAEVAETMQLAAGQVVDKDIIVGVGKAQANAFYTQGGEKVDSGDLSWKVFKGTKKLDGTRDQVTYAYGPDSKFDLPPGDYVMAVDMQAASAEQPFSVKVGEMSDVNVTLNAGVLAVEAPGADGFKVFEAKKNLQGERKQVTYAYGETMQTTLASGDYVLVTDFTTDKADSETPFTIKAGERSEVKVP